MKTSVEKTLWEALIKISRMGSDTSLTAHQKVAAMTDMARAALAEEPPLVGRVRMAQLVPVVGLSRPTIYRMVVAGTFPAPLRISARASLYDAAEVNEWIRDPVGWAARNKAAQAAPTTSGEVDK